jgi:hypothetical protein
VFISFPKSINIIPSLNAENISSVSLFISIKSLKNIINLFIFDSFLKIVNFD